MVNAAVDRFERRLTEEISSLRVEIAQVEARLEQRLGGLRQEMYQGFVGLRQEVATNRVELLKWSFLFWVGQVAVVAGLLAFMLRR